MARLNYVELPVGNVGQSRAFFEAAFGWSLTPFGPAYAATEGQGTDLGLDGDAGDRTAPLPVIEVDDLEAAQASVQAAGASLPVPYSPSRVADASISASHQDANSRCGACCPRSRPPVGLFGGRWSGR